MLLEEINSDFKKAMRNHDKLIINVLRMLINAIRNKEIFERKHGEVKFSDDDIVAILRGEVKKMRDSIVAFEKGDRQDLVKKEKEEIQIIEKYLPKQMSENKIKEITKDVIISFGEVHSSDFGKVMGVVMSKVNGQADGNIVSAIVKKSLA